MVTLSKVKGSEKEKDGSRTIKVLEYGVKTGAEVSSFGDDSNPLKDLTAIYSNTGENGEPVILGYINENQIAESGEKRIYSLKPDGSLSSYFWLKNDGSAELLGANDKLVRYTALELKLQEQINKLNAELAKIVTAISSVGGSYANTPLSIDFSGAKIEEIDVI